MEDGHSDTCGRADGVWKRCKRLDREENDTAGISGQS